MGRLNLQARAARASLAAATTVTAALKRRVFNEGGAENGKIGQYRSRSYRKKRQKANRQTAYKDLEFNGDLRRSIQVAGRTDGAVIGFVTARGRNIAGYQEEQTGRAIFGLSAAELALARRTFVKCYRGAS